MDADNSKKTFLMKVGVTVVVVIIVAAWSANLKNVWLKEKDLASEKTNNQDWVALKTNLEKTLVDVQTSLANVKEATNQKDKADKNAFLGDVLEGAKQIASSTDTATSSVATSSVVMPIIANPGTATTSPVLPASGCPEYINCMPTIGEARPCQIPVGCEGKTIIAY